MAETRTGRTRRTRQQQDVDLGEVISNETEKSIEKGTFMDKIWKPAFAVCYMLICIFDFIISCCTQD